ncbi:MAG: CDP-alcohol phosphatidyltransferase family protein [Bacteroidales bacterium]|jgi:uncharacterized membrane protein|nr:CDP-alcohol phosphatidyltransferase family protein [Bacteroidales bacterium]
MKQDIKSTYKSLDTEEPIDIYFYRPIGYFWAKIARKLHITPNMITIASIFIGAAAGILFYYPDLILNIVGMLLLVLANSFDSADGQLARMTNNKTQLGRILDGLAGNIWFIIIYVVIALRTVNQGFYGLPNYWIWIIASIAGAFHILHANIADYYRNIHLYFLEHGKGGEFDNSKKIKAELKSLTWKKNFFKKVTLLFYWNYTHTQEMMTPKFQKFISKVREKYPDNNLPEDLCNEFRKGSKPLMKFTNILQFNTRVIVLFICIFLNMPFLYFFFDLLILTPLMLYMIHKHEKLSKQLINNF